MEFSSAGVTVEVMTASTPHDERQLTIRRFEQGITKIIINVGVLVAGFDSDVRCIIFARPTKSEMRWIQTLGVAYVPPLAKITASSSTTAARSISWAIPMILNMTISRHHQMAWKKPAASCKTDEAEKLPKECSQCHYVKPAGIYICPKCGFKPLAGEDVETDKSRGLKKVSKAEVKYTAEQKQSWWSQILFISAPAQHRDARSVMAGVRIPTNKNFVWPRGYTTPRSRSHLK
jgi:superfamily II DNA or RNA helicase